MLRADAKNPLTLGRGKGDPFTKRIHGVREARCRHSRDDLIANQIQVTSPVPRELRREGVGGQQRRRHGDPGSGKGSPHLQHLHFRLQIEAVARLDLDGGRSKVDHALEPLTGAVEQILGGRLPGSSNGREDSPSRTCDLLVAGPLKALLPLFGTRSTVHQVRVTVDQSGCDPGSVHIQSLTGRRQRSLGGLCRLSNPDDEPVTHQNEGIANDAVRATSSLRHGRNVCVIQRQIRLTQSFSSIDVSMKANLHSSAMSHLFFDSALLPGGWADDVRIGVDPGGWISSVESGADAHGARHVPGVAVPGVPNVHSHSFQRAMAGLTERGSPGGDTFWSWRRRMYEFLDAIGPQAVEAISAQLFVELLRRGFTSVAEFHYLRNRRDGSAFADPVEMARRVLRAADDTGMGVTILPTLYAASDFGGAPLEAGQRRFSSSVDALIGDIAILGAGAPAGTVRVGLALHSLRAVPPDALASVVESARSMDPSLPIHIHVAEQQREVDGCVAWSGLRPVAWLLEHAPVDRHWCLIHATHMDDVEVEGVASSGAVVGLCPTTEANLGDGIFPFPAFQHHAGRWAIGTDSHVGRGPAGELRMLEYSQRLQSKTRNVAAGLHHRSTGRALLEEALRGGAAASGRRIGVLEPGARADVVVLDPEHDALLGRAGDDLLDSWIFSGDDTPVRHVFTGGRHVIQDGRHPAQERIRERFRSCIRELPATVFDGETELDPLP